MRQFFITIIGTIFMLNMFMLLIPETRYEKYVKYVVGIIIITVIASNLFSVRVDHDILNFDKTSFEFNENNLNEKVNEQLTDDTLTKIIEDETGVKVKMNSVYKENSIDKIYIEGGLENKDEIISILLRECDINRTKIVVK